jgi:hypothetical protein
MHSIRSALRVGGIALAISAVGLLSACDHDREKTTTKVMQNPDGSTTTVTKKKDD